MSPHVDGAAASAAESQVMLLHRSGKPRWKCGEIYTWNSIDFYAVECALCDDRILCTLTEFASHMQIWHRSWESESNEACDDSEAVADNSDEDEIEMAAEDPTTTENEKESQGEEVEDDDEKDATDTETEETTLENQEYVTKPQPAGELTTEEEAEEEAQNIQCVKIIGNLSITCGKISDSEATADCSADAPTSALLISPNQLKISDEEIATGQELPATQPFEEVLIIDVEAEMEAEPAFINQVNKVQYEGDTANNEQMEDEEDSDAKFELENQIENDIESNLSEEAAELSNSSHVMESPANEFGNGDTQNTSFDEQVTYGENVDMDELPPHAGKLTKDHMLLLIELYKKQPRLWNTAHKEFSETHLCRASWQEITENFNVACHTNFEVNELKIRISTLCQRYLAEKRRLSYDLEMNNNENPKFIHFNALRFLDEQPYNLQSRRFIFYRQNLKLIEIYRDFPILWHSAKKLKLSPSTRAEALEEISEALKNYNINLSSKSIQRRLHVLHKYYHKEKLNYLHCRREGREFRTNFKHFSQMQFLERHIAPFVCIICNKIFEKLQDFRIHVNNVSHEMEQCQQKEKSEDLAYDEDDAEIVKSLEKMKVTDDDDVVIEQLDIEDSIKVNVIEKAKVQDVVGRRKPERMTLDDISSIISKELNSEKSNNEISVVTNDAISTGLKDTNSNSSMMLFNQEPSELLKFFPDTSATASQKCISTNDEKSKSLEIISSTIVHPNKSLIPPQNPCPHEEQIINITQDSLMNQNNSVNIVQDVMSNTEVLNSEIHYSMNNSLLTFNADLQDNILADMIVTSQSCGIETQSLQYVLSDTTNNFNATQTQDINNTEQLYGINSSDFSTTPLDYRTTATTSPMAISQNGINILHDEAYIATQYLLNITPQSNIIMPQDFLSDQIYAMNVTQNSANNSPNSYIAAPDSNVIHFSSPNELSHHNHHSLTSFKTANYAPSINNCTATINPNDFNIIVERQVINSNALISASNLTTDISAANSPYRKSDTELEMELRKAAMNCSSLNPLIGNGSPGDIMVKPHEIILEKDLPVLQREIEITADLPITHRIAEIPTASPVQTCRDMTPNLTAQQNETAATVADMPVVQPVVSENAANTPLQRRRARTVATFNDDVDKSNEKPEKKKKPPTKASVKRLSEEQTRYLIERYKEQPILWNPNHKNFESRRGRRLAWKAMANALNKYYNIRFPWQTIYKKVCDCLKYYRKENARVTGRKGTISKWCYYKDFSFIDEHLDSTSEEQRTLQEKEINYKIIKIYKTFPQLWNTNTAEYKKRSQRNIHTAAMHNSLREQCNVEIPLDKLRRKLIELRFAYRQEKEKRIECAQNNEAFESFYEYYKELEFLDDHISPFICNACGEAFTKLTDIMCHYRVTKHQKIIKKRMSKKKVAATNAAEVELKNICHICGAKFTMRNNLMYHLNRHLGKRTHKCASCPKSFYNSTALRVHERSHTKEYPYVCEECGQAFVNNSKLNQHKKRHRNQRDFKCDECGKDFFSAYERDKHIKRHKKVRDTFCPICGKGFVVGSSIYSHMDLHSEVKKYACKICEKRFAQYSGLYRHMRVHNLVKDEEKVEQPQEEQGEI